MSPPPTKTTWHCDRCDGTNVFEQVYVNPNTGDRFHEQTSEGWCDDCATHHDDGSAHLVVREKPLKGQD
jgi:hypothetical protein